MKKTAFSIASFLLAAAVLFLSGCDSGSGSSSKNNADPGQLLGSWDLISLQSQPPVAGSSVTISFKSDDTFGGSSGVNSYGGSYTAGTGGSLKLGQILSTLMASSDPALQAQESAYYNALGLVARYSVASGVLTLAGSNGTALVAFKRN